MVHRRSIARAGLLALLSESDRCGFLRPLGGFETAAELCAALLPPPANVCAVATVVGIAHKHDQAAYDAIQQLRRSFVALGVIAFGPGSGGISIARSFEAGANAFVDEEDSPEELAHAVADVALTGFHALAPTTWTAGLRQAEMTQDACLTGKGREVIRLVALGLTDREVARRLQVRERTVHTHLVRIYRKLGVHSRVAAVSAVLGTFVASD